MEMKGEKIRADLTRVWASTHSTLLGRVEKIELALDALERGTADALVIEEATSEAHKLAGVLGTFGLGRGSALAGEIEERLEVDCSSDCVERLRRLATELHAIVANALIAE
jgi:HPt (histidine-containing phosphotransfer) domain-containing protein